MSALDRFAQAVWTVGRLGGGTAAERWHRASHYATGAQWFALCLSDDDVRDDLRLLQDLAWQHALDAAVESIPAGDAGTLALKQMLF